MDCDLVSLEPDFERSTNLFVHDSENRIHSFDDRYIGPEFAQSAAEFEADVAATNDGC